MAADRSDAVVRSDADPLFCSTLLHARNFTDAGRSGPALAERCRALIATARENGWDTNWLAYSEATLEAVEGHDELALAALERAFARGMRAHGLLTNVRSFERLAGHPGFTDLVQRMKAAAEKARKTLTGN